MKSLPPFDENGILPPGVYACDEETLRQRFVDDFSQCQKERLEIFEGFIKLRKDAESLGISVTQWVDGSFVTRKLNPMNKLIELPPNDIDVVNFVDFSRYKNSGSIEKFFMDCILNGGSETKKLYRTDSYLVIVLPREHPEFPLYEELRKYWLDLFGHTRELFNSDGNIVQSKMPKGILELYIGDPENHLKILQKGGE